MSLTFKLIPKKPKDKFEILNERKIVGYLEFMPEYRQYYFIAAFESKLSSNACKEIICKIDELNDTIK